MPQFNKGNGDTTQVPSATAELAFMENGDPKLYNCNPSQLSSSLGWLDIRSYMDGLSGRPTLAAWEADNTTDATLSLQAALDVGGEILIPSNSTFEIKTVTVTKSVNISGGGALKRPDDYDQEYPHAVTANLPMFDITAHGIDVTFSGITFDGNEASQSAVSPGGVIIRAANVAGAITSTLNITVDNCTFKDITASGIILNGLTSSDGRQILTVQNSTFLDGRIGMGKDDPACPDPLGFLPIYINVYDHAQLICKNNKFLFRKTLAATGEYPPSAIRWTYSGATVNADGASGMVSGNYFYGLGRDDEYYDGTLTGNNPMGVVDFYARGREMIITNNTFDNNVYSAVRGKNNCDKVVVSGNIIEGGQIGINIHTPTADTQAGFLSIANNVMRSVIRAGIYIIGGTAFTPAYARAIVISGNVIEGVSGGTGIDEYVGGIATGNLNDVTISDNVIQNIANGYGIYMKASLSAKVHGNHIRDITTQRGIYLNGLTENASVNGNTVIDCGGIGIIISATTTADVVASNNIVDGAVDYGIITFTGGANSVTYTGNSIHNISGLSRGLYVPDLAVIAVVTGNTSTTTTPFFYFNDGSVQLSGNSWEPLTAYGAAAPTGGTWKVGDLVINTSPTVGQPKSWVCTVAGTPGTWVSTGNL